VKALTAGLAIVAAMALNGQAARAEAALPPDTLPYSDVHAGMTGTGKTVFHGGKPETFDVEILGKVDRIGPGQNLILAKLGGSVLAQTGVLEGMSGRPSTSREDDRRGRLHMGRASRSRDHLTRRCPMPDGGARVALVVRGASTKGFRLEEPRAPARGGALPDARARPAARRPAVVRRSRLGLPIASAGLSQSWIRPAWRRPGGRAHASALGRRGPGPQTLAPRAVCSGASAPGSGADTPADRPRTHSRRDAVGAKLVQGDTR
jgi:hypothetical protein